MGFGFTFRGLFGCSVWWFGLGAAIWLPLLFGLVGCCLVCGRYVVWFDLVMIRSAVSVIGGWFAWRISFLFLLLSIRLG